MLQNYTAILAAKTKLNHTIYAFTFKLTKPTNLSFQAGQYLLLDIKTGYRQYSISSSPSQTSILETLVDVKPMGLGSKFLLNLQLNDQVTFRAPMGMFTLKNTENPKVFLATGAGISPIKAMILQLEEQNFSPSFSLFWGVAQKQDLYLQDLWSDIKQNHANFNFSYCLSKETKLKTPYFCGHIQEALLNQTLLPKTEFYLCGRPQTVKAIQDFLIQDLQIAPEFIFHENFT